MIILYNYFVGHMAATRLQYSDCHSSIASFHDHSNVTLLCPNRSLTISLLFFIIYNSASITIHFNPATALYTYLHKSSHSISSDTVSSPPLHLNITFSAHVATCDSPPDRLVDLLRGSGDVIIISISAGTASNRTQPRVAHT